MRYRAHAPARAHRRIPAAAHRAARYVIDPSSLDSTAMTRPPRFPRIVYTAAGVYGLFVMLPQYWMEVRIGHDTPPAITHPEYFYGFIGVVVAWQLVFLRIARDPVLHRAIMPITVVEKLGFGLPALVLYAQHRLDRTVLAFGVLDLVWAALFTTCGLMTSPRRARIARAVALTRATGRQG
jgi:hypothetical protein